MTYQYSNINQHDALYNAARMYPGGIEALAQRMVMSVNTLRNKLRPSIDTHHINFEEVSRVIELLEEAKVVDAFIPLQAFCWRHNYVAVQLPAGDVDADDLLRQMVEVMSGDGALANDISSALRDDHRIDDRERDQIEQRLEQCIGALVALRDKVRAKNEADFHGAK